MKMFPQRVLSHAPQGYICPICLAVEGTESDKTMIRQADIFYRDDSVIGFIGSKWIPRHSGVAVAATCAHAENAYCLSPKQMAALGAFQFRLVSAVKRLYRCDGVSVVQHNEPAGDQHAFHAHVLVVPRTSGVPLYPAMSEAYVSAPEDRVPYANMLRDFFAGR